MEIRVTPTELPEVLLVETDFVADARGFFVETYHRDQYRAHGITDEFVQDNHSRSARGVLRGIHYQDFRQPQAKLVRCTAGTILDVAVDLRAGSPRFGQWVALELNPANKHQLYVPIGFGHAFLALEEGSEVQYRCSSFYAPETEGSIRWDDPGIGIRWPITEPVLSARDADAPSFAQYRQSPAFQFEPHR